MAGIAYGTTETDTPQQPVGSVDLAGPPALAAVRRMALASVVARRFSWFSRGSRTCRPKAPAQATHVNRPMAARFWDRHHTSPKAAGLASSENP